MVSISLTIDFFTQLNEREDIIMDILEIMKEDTA